MSWEIPILLDNQYHLITRDHNTKKRTYLSIAVCAMFVETIRLFLAALPSRAQDSQTIEFGFGFDVHENGALC